MRALKIALISAAIVVGCAGYAAAQYDPYTPSVDEEGGVPQRCSIEYSAMIGKDRRKNDLAFKIVAIVDAKASPSPTAYFTINGQRLARSVEKLMIVQASVNAGGIVQMAGGVAKPTENGGYTMASMGEAELKLPLAMADGSTVTLTDEDDDTPITLTLPAASAATKQALFSCYQRATGLPESVRPEMPGATTPAQ